MRSDDASRRHLAGWIWVSALQFFIAQAVVQESWTTQFSLASNYISDLGNTACAPYPAGSSSYVCSPWHAVMNASFIVTGLSLLAGALLLRRAFGTGRTIAAGLTLIALGGPGFILVGVFPENVNHPPHYLGAALNFAGANAGLIVLGVASLAGLGRPMLARRAAAYTAASGMIGLAATALLVTEHFLGAGAGSIERIAAYPLPIWMIVTGTLQLLR